MWHPDNCLCWTGFSFGDDGSARSCSVTLRAVRLCTNFARASGYLLIASDDCEECRRGRVAFGAPNQV